MSGARYVCMSVHLFLRLAVWLRLQVWGEHVEITAGLVLTHFMFSLPADAPASFATHTVSLRWVLRFEFTTSVAKPASWLSGGPTPERIAWALPVLVRPPAVPRSL